MAEPADLDQLRARLGFKSTDKDPVLAQCLDAAVAWVNDRIYVTAAPDLPYWRAHDDVYEAAMLKAARLYSRQRTPEGSSSWPDLGVIQVVDSDPDIERLLERHIDCSRAGVA